MPSEPATGNTTRRHGAPPTGYKPHSQALCEHDEGDDRQPGEGADDQRQNQKYLALTLPQLSQALEEPGVPAVPAGRRSADSSSFGYFSLARIALDWKGGPEVGRLLFTGGYRSNAKWSTLFCCQHCSLSSVPNGFSFP